MSSAALCIEACRADGRLSVRILNTRPRVEGLLQQRTPAQVLALVPSLYSLCGKAQGAAAALALAAAEGGEVAPVQRLALGRAVWRERIREQLWRILLDWPGVCGIAAEREMLAHCYRQLGNQTWGSAEDRQALSAWLGLRGQALEGWGRALLQAWIQREPPLPGQPLPTVLPSGRPARWVAHLAGQALQPLLASPHLDGLVAEAGALERAMTHPEVTELWAQGLRVAARLRARLHVLACDLQDADEQALMLGAGVAIDHGGLACVMSARGTLMHALRLKDGVVSEYAVIAPTDWNFQAAGSFALEAQRLGAQTEVITDNYLRALALALDPCVAFDLQVTGNEACEHA